MLSTPISGSQVDLQLSSCASFGADHPGRVRRGSPWTRHDHPMRRHPRAVPVVLSTVLLAGFLAACGSDGITRPTLPNRTTTVAGSAPVTDPAATPAPTAPPTESPTAPPTEAPSTPPPTEPAATPAPTPEPTPEPTLAPTVAPTEPPTVAPTVAPTAAPTVAPTEPPTVAPTEAPTTLAPATSAPETSAPETSTPATSEPVGDADDDGTTWWPWVVAGLLLALIIAAVVGRRRRPSWDDRVRGLLDDVDVVTRRLAALSPGDVVVVAETDAAALATARASLTSLLAESADDRRAAVLGALTEPLADLHLAVGSAALTGGIAGAAPAPGAPLPPPGAPTPAAAPSVAQLAAVVHTTSATVRASIVPPPPPQP